MQRKQIDVMFVPLDDSYWVAICLALNLVAGNCDSDDLFRCACFGPGVPLAGGVATWSEHRLHWTIRKDSVGLAT